MKGESQKITELAKILKLLVKYKCSYAKIGEIELQWQHSEESPLSKPRAIGGLSQSSAQIDDKQAEEITDKIIKERAANSLLDEVEELQLLDPSAYEKLVIEGVLDEQGNG